MSVRSVLTSLDAGSATPGPSWAATGGRGLSRASAAALVMLSVGVVILALTDTGDAICLLLALPVWIVSRNLGLIAGAAVAVGALPFISLVLGSGDTAFAAAVFSAAVAAGTQAIRPAGKGGAKPPSPLLHLLTVRPEVIRRTEALSRRELEVLEKIATGAKNAEIADRFVISQNTVKSHVSQILKKLAVANRTEAAFRYIELYGPPTPPNGSTPAVDVGGQEEDTTQIGAVSALMATLSAFHTKDRVLLTLQDGRDLEVPLLDQIRGHADVGTAAIVYFDQLDHMVGWYLPGEDLGVDLRHWAP